MGYMRHHAIIVTGWEDSRTKTAHAKAVELFGSQVSGIVPSPINGYSSFFIAPDGSKEGWEDSDAGDVARKAFKDWITPEMVEWVEVQYADDNRSTRVVDSSDGHLGDE